MISTPDAVARIAVTVPIPEKLKCRRYSRPVTMSHTANNSNPMLLFIVETPINKKYFNDVLGI
jgi:hypothetical protein